MTSVPSPSQLAEIDDAALERLAVDWRARAGYGDRDAFGFAHALEVERRRRLRVTRLLQPPPAPAPDRPWWKFWHPKMPQTAGDGPMSPT